jgi:Ca-activated chloride channel family protein
MFELACPYILLAAPLPWLIWYLLPVVTRQMPSALRVPFFKAMTGVVAKEQPRTVQYRWFSFLFLAYLLILFALAGPRYRGDPEPLAQEGYNVMLALDISGSMEMSDMRLFGRPATRLDVVKNAAMQFVRDRIGDRIGLILFASRAYLLTPLTYDKQNVLQRLEDATVGLAGKTTSLGDALGLAVKRLQNVAAKGRMIILLTDGVNNAGLLAPLKAAELARADGIKVYTIGLGSESTATNSMGGMLLNLNVMAELDEETLKQIAQMTGGRYFRATDSQSLQAIYQSINQIEKTSQEQPAVRPLQDYYMWPGSLALLLLFLWVVFRYQIWGLRDVN